MAGCWLWLAISQQGGPDRARSDGIRKAILWSWRRTNWIHIYLPENFPEPLETDGEGFHWGLEDLFAEHFAFGLKVFVEGEVGEKAEDSIKHLEDEREQEDEQRYHTLYQSWSKAFNLLCGYKCVEWVVENILDAYS